MTLGGSDDRWIVGGVEFDEIAGEIGEELR
jgi:hypothetical protein